MAYLPTQKWQIPVTPAATLNEVAGTGSSSAMPVAAELAPLRVIYGYAWVSTQIANIVGDGGYYVMQCVWGEGEIDNIRIFSSPNGDPLPTGTLVHHYLGTPGQTVDSYLVSEFYAKGITYTDALPNIAYSVLKIPKSYGMPNLAVEITGRKLYDPRSGLTVFSDNPALALADFASNTRYGLGLTVDWASVAVVANLCDELVGGEKRRTIGLEIDTPVEADKMLDTLATYAGCWAIIEGTTLKLVPDRPVATSRSFSHASGEILSIKNLKKRGAAGTPTVVDVRFRQPLAVWLTNSVKAYAAGVLAGTTPYRESQVSLPGIWTKSQANREAIERLNKFQLADLSCTLEVFDEALALQPGDVVEVTHPIGLTAKPFRVQRIESNLGRHTLDLLEYDPAVYSNAVVSEPTFEDTSLANPLVEAPAAVTDITADEEIYQSRDGTVASRLRIFWLNADLWPVDYSITIYRMDDAGGTGILQVASSVTTDPSYVHGPLEDNYWYRISITQTRKQWPLTSVAATLNVQALGKLIPPSDVASLSATVTPAGVVLTWPVVIDIDMSGYRVKEGAALLATATTTTVNLGFVALGAHTYTINAFDRSGGESATAASTTVTVPAMGAVGSLVGAVGSGDMVLSWSGASSAWPLAGYEVRYGGADWASSTLAATVNATRYTGAVGYTGGRVWRVKALDVIGNYGPETTSTVTVTAPPAVTGFSTQFVGVDVQLNWALVSSDLPVRHYEVRYGGSWAAGTVAARVSSSTVRLPVNWTSRQFWIAAVDTDGNVGTATATATATVVSPTQVSTFTATLLQTDVRLDWAPSAVGSLSVSYYIVKFGGVYASGQLIGNINSTTLKVPVDWAGSRTFWVAPVDPLGNVGTELSVSTTVSAPGAVSPAASVIGNKVSLTWSAATAGLPVKHYEIRHGASWAAGSLVAKADTTDYRVPVTWTGARTFWIAAVDTNLTEGTPASVSATINAPAAPTVSQSITLDTANLVWTTPASSLPISDYEIRHGASWAAGTPVGRVLGTVLAVPVTWLAGRTFWVSAYDINGTVGAAGSATVTIAAPSAPSITAQVIDNNVLLYWSGSTGTLPVETYELRKGATWAGAILIGRKSGGFTTVLETSAGIYTYWVAGVDTAGNYGTPAQYTAQVNQPPDYVLNKQWDSTLGANALVIDFGLSIAVDVITKIGTSTAWDSAFHSVTGYTGGAFVSFVPQQTLIDVMVGLDSNPTQDNNYPNIDYACHLNGANNVYWYESNAYGLLGSYAAGDVFAVHYDGTNVRYYKNGAVIRTVAASIGVPLYADSTFYTPGMSVRDFRFGNQYNPAYSSNNASDVDGSRILGASSTATWTNHFTGNSWTSPQDQVTAGYPVYIQPASLPATYEETFDYGTVLAATKVTVTYAGATVSGSPVLTGEISTSPDNATWTTYSGFSAYGTAFRYVKARLTCTGGQYDLAQFTLTLDSKIRNDAGTATLTLGGAHPQGNIAQDYRTWTAGMSMPPAGFVLNGPSSENRMVSVAGPGGNPEVCWACVDVSTDNDGDGGWDSSAVSTVTTSIGHVFAVWVKRANGDGTFYFGTTGVSNLGGGVNGNPYFWYGDAPDTSWYLMVGFVHPNGYAGASTGLCGLYNTSGARVIADFDEFRLSTGQTTLSHRCYQYYNVAGTGAEVQWMTRPVIIPCTAANLANMIAYLVKCGVGYGAAVDFNIQFVDVAAINCSPSSTSAVITVTDFTDKPNPKGFNIFNYTTAGAPTGGAVSWSVRGY